VEESSGKIESNRKEYYVVCELFFFHYVVREHFFLS
jgi:hypothetical protein